MKILFVLGFPNPFPGAGWTRIGFFADAWSRKGNYVEVLGVFSYKSFQKKGVGRYGKVNVFNIIFNMGLTYPPVFLLNSLISFLVSTFFLLAKRPNVVVVSVPTGDVGLGALMACELFGAKCVVDYRDEWEDYTISLANGKTERLFYSAVKRITYCLYTKTQLVVAVTSNLVEALRRRGLTNVELIPNGADIKTFKPLATLKSHKMFNIFYSGGVGGYYKLNVAVKSIKKLVDSGVKNVKLVVAGTGEIQEVLNLATQLGISGHIDYQGVINDKTRLAELIAGADVGLIPYDDNPLWKNAVPAKFYEYCACGIPVIATAHNDSLLAEIIRRHQIGVTSPPLDEEKLTNAILLLYHDKSFRKAAGKRARKLIEEKFDRNKIAEKFLNLVMERA